MVLSLIKGTLEEEDEIKGTLRKKDDAFRF